MHVTLLFIPPLFDWENVSWVERWFDYYNSSVQLYVIACLFLRSPTSLTIYIVRLIYEYIRETEQITFIWKGQSEVIMRAVFSISEKHAVVHILCKSDNYVMHGLAGSEYRCNLNSIFTLSRFSKLPAHALKCNVNN